MNKYDTPSDGYMILAKDGEWYEADEVDTRIQELEEALEEIAKGDGPYDMDPLKHAGNCIKNMVSIATKALCGEKKEEEK